MEKEAKIFVAGAKGLVGSAVVRRLRRGGFTNLLTPSRAQLDLTKQYEVAAFFKLERPEYVLMAAAKVGGIHANNTFPAEFIFSNLEIQNNIIHQAYLHGVKRLLFLGSSCIYPKFAPQPIGEGCLLTGAMEPTNEPYAIAKIAGIKMCEAYNRQYGTRFIAAMPTNLYGVGDNFHPENSHVLPALLRRLHEAKKANSREVVVWGTGQPMREFLYVDDAADGCVFLLELDDDVIDRKFLQYPEPCFVNIGTGCDVTIRELAEIIGEEVGFEGVISFDHSKPDGTPRKLLDVSKIESLGWQAKTSLREGIRETYRWFLENEGQVRE